MKTSEQTSFSPRKQTVLDTVQVLGYSAKFFRANGFTGLASALPDKPRFSAENREKIVAAISGDFGGVRFDRAFAFPALADLNKYPIVKFKQQFADRPMRGLSNKEQYSESFLENGVEKSKIIPAEAQLRQRPYLLMYSSLPIPLETKGLTFPAEQTLFAQRQWNGLWLPEHYVVQRAECALNRDHRFDAWDGNPVKSQTSWLLATIAPSGCVFVDFNPLSRRAWASWHSSSASNRGLGARPAVVVEML